MVLKKRGQGSGSSAAAVIAIIAVFLVIYILLVPPSERAKILEEDTGTGVTPDFKDKVLLDTVPGKVEYFSMTRKEHKIPQVHIFTKLDSVLFARRESMYIKRSLFSSKIENITFAVDDIENIKSLFISMAVKKGTGRLKITLNGHEIHNQEISYGNLGPIEIPKELLSYSNSIVISTDSPALAFWRTHEYNLEELMVFGDVKFTDTKEVERIFHLSKQEFDNMEKTTLNFNIFCDQDINKGFEAKINGKSLFKGTPVCGDRFNQELSINYLNEGENKLYFKIQDGGIMLSNVYVETRLKQIAYPSYFFELSKEEAKSIANDRLRVILNIGFSQAMKDKRGELHVNKKRYSFDTSRPLSELDISDAIIQGENVVTIIPKGVSLEVHLLKVTLTK